jgi:hypothetical protein
LIFISIRFSAKVSKNSLSTKLFTIFACEYVNDMADNYLEKKYEDLQARKAKEQRARQVAWKKRMDAYRKKLAASQENASPQGERPAADRQDSHPEPRI